MSLLRFILYHIQISILCIQYIYDNHCKFNCFKETYSADIKKSSLMLSTYFQDSGFFDKLKRADWSSLDACKDKDTENLLKPRQPFLVQYVQDITHLGSNTL